METTTANSPDDLSARVLAELKIQLERLTSFTAEIGILRESSGSAVHAASSVLRLVDQLGELQQNQISELRAVSDATLDIHRDELAHVADAWGEKWLQEATKSLTVLDEIVARQHALATEITEFQEAMRNAGSFADAQLSMHKQILSLSDEMRQDSAARAVTFELLMARSDAIGAEMQRLESVQSEAFTGLASFLRDAAGASENATKLLQVRQSEMIVALQERDSLHTQEMQRLAKQNEELLNAQVSIGGQLSELSQAQSKQHEYVCNAVLAGQLSLIHI